MEDAGTTSWLASGKAVQVTGKMMVDKMSVWWYFLVLLSVAQAAENHDVHPLECRFAFQHSELAHILGLGRRSPEPGESHVPVVSPVHDVLGLKDRDVVCLGS